MCSWAKNMRNRASQGRVTPLQCLQISNISDVVTNMERNKFYNLTANIVYNNASTTIKK